MATSDQGGKIWLKYGCIGCAGIIGFLILAAGGLAGIAFLQVGSEEVVDQDVVPELPAFPASGVAAAGTPELEDPGEIPPPGSVAAGVRGKVVLDLAHAEFQVVPGEPGEKLRVHAKYDKKVYELEEILETHEDSSWTYRVNFHQTGGGIMTALKEMFGGTKPEVRIVLPVDVPLDLDTRTQQGAMIIDLGGLWLRRADFNFQQGGFELSVSEPLREPMEAMSIDGSMGGLVTAGLGNASPRRLECDFSMGGLVLDLRGPWARDAEISIAQSMGGGAIRLPRNVILQGIPGRQADAAADAELKPPTLRFTVSSSMGELEYID
jgi:hypothetical protein